MCDEQPPLFRCANSPIYYHVYTFNNIVINSFYVDAVCEEDPKFHQICGLVHGMTQPSTKPTLCEAKICSLLLTGLRDSDKIPKLKYAIEYPVGMQTLFANDGICNNERNCENTDLDERDCAGDPEDTGVVKLPSGDEISPILICNGICDHMDITRNLCEDEADCGGFQYGRYCKSDLLGNMYLHPVQVCTIAEDVFCNGIQYNSNMALQPEKCRKDAKSGDYKTCVHISSGLETPVYDQDRCAVINNPGGALPICNGAGMLYQLNCTDPAKVAGHCEVDGYMSTFSKAKICFMSQPASCDNGLDNACIRISPQCDVHKHRLCDGIFDCERHEDELHDDCSMLTRTTCVRTVGDFTRHLPLPFSWVHDEVQDCMDGRDEGHWPTCGIGDRERKALDPQNCLNVYICREGSNKNIIEFPYLCDNNADCLKENAVCGKNAGFKIETRPVSTDKGVSRQFWYCLKGLESLEDIYRPCRKELFRFPAYQIDGLDTSMLLTVPAVKTDCSSLYGENYLYFACLGLCPGTACLLNFPPKYESIFHPSLSVLSYTSIDYFSSFVFIQAYF